MLQIEKQLLAEFGDFATSILDNDADFKAALQDGIKNKELQKTLTLLQGKAKAFGSQKSLDIPGKKNLAYVIFLKLLEELPLNASQKRVMSNTVYKRIMGKPLPKDSEGSSVGSKGPSVPGISKGPAIPKIAGTPGKPKPSMFATSGSKEKTSSSKPPSLFSRPSAEEKTAPAKPPSLFSRPSAEEKTAPSKPPSLFNRPSAEQTTPEPEQSTALPKISGRTTPPAGPKSSSSKSIFGSALVGKETIDPALIAENIGQSRDHLLTLVAAVAVKKDEDFAFKINHAIDRKDLKATIINLKEKAIEQGKHLNLDLSEKKMLAFLLFHAVFVDNENILPEQKKVMTRTIYKKLTGLVDFDTAIKKIDEILAAIQENGYTEHRVASQLSFSPSFVEEFLGQKKEELGEELEAGGERKEYLETITPGSLPFLTLIAHLVTLEDSSFVRELNKFVEAAQVKTVLKLIKEKSKEYGEDFGLSEEQEKELAFLIFYYCFEQLESAKISAQRRRTMQKSLFETVTGKKYDDFLTELTEIEGKVAEYKLIDEKLINDVLSGKYLTEDAKNRVQRDIARRGLEKAKEEDTAPKDYETVEKIESWLRSDSKFLKKISKIEKIDGNSLKIFFDIQTEGVIKTAEITGRLIQKRKFNVIKLTIVSYLPAGSPYSYAIGDGKEKFIAATVMGNVDNDQECQLELDTVNFDQAMTWDTLKYRLNSEKKLLKSMKKKLGRGYPGVPEDEIIKIPVKLMRGKPAKMTVRTYMLEDLKPRTVFFDVFDGLGYVLDDIEDLGGLGGGMSIQAKMAKIGEKEEKDYRGYEFAYLEKDSAVDLRPCPHCDRPFPDYRAEYRRCPYCLKKIPPDFWID